MSDMIKKKLIEWQSCEYMFLFWFNRLYLWKCVEVKVKFPQEQNKNVCTILKYIYSTNILFFSGENHFYLFCFCKCLFTLLSVIEVSFVMRSHHATQDLNLFFPAAGASHL